jgi:hypothetical protein
VPEGKRADPEFYEQVLKSLSKWVSRVRINVKTQTVWLFCMIIPLLICSFCHYREALPGTSQRSDQPPTLVI